MISIRKMVLCGGLFGVLGFGLTIVAAACCPDQGTTQMAAAVQAPVVTPCGEATSCSVSIGWVNNQPTFSITCSPKGWGCMTSYVLNDAYNTCGGGTVKGVKCVNLTDPQGNPVYALTHTYGGGTCGQRSQSCNPCTEQSSDYLDVKKTTANCD